MPNGDVTLLTSRTLNALMLDAADGTATNNGAWIDCREYDAGTVMVDGVATAAVITVFGNNGLARPLNTLNTGAIATTGNPTTAGSNPTVQIPILPRWIKAGITTLGTGTVTVTLCARII